MPAASRLDDHHRNPNTNNRDHLVGYLTTSQRACFLLSRFIFCLLIFSTLIFKCGGSERILCWLLPLEKPVFFNLFYFCVFFSVRVRMRGFYAGCLSTSPSLFRCTSISQILLAKRVILFRLEDKLHQDFFQIASTVLIDTLSTLSTIVKNGQSF